MLLQCHPNNTDRMSPQLVYFNMTLANNSTTGLMTTPTFCHCEFLIKTWVEIRYNIIDRLDTASEMIEVAFVRRVATRACITHNAAKTDCLCYQ